MITGADVTAKDTRVLWWKCRKCGDEYQQAVCDRVRDFDAGIPCPRCEETRKATFPADFTG